jgi:hypothetical protein
MAGKFAWLAKALLDWAMGGATPTRPTSRKVHFYTTLPSKTDTGGVEVSTGVWTNYAAVTATYDAATSAHPSATANTGDTDFGIAATTGNVILAGYATRDQLGNGLYRGTLGGTLQAFSADASTDVLTAAAHGYNDGDAVVLEELRNGAALPTGLSEGVVYFVRDKTTNTFKLAATSGGAAIDVTAAGSGGYVRSCVIVQNGNPIKFSAGDLDLLEY